MEQEQPGGMREREGKPELGQAEPAAVQPTGGHGPHQGWDESWGRVFRKMTRDGQKARDVMPACNWADGKTRADAPKSGALGLRAAQELPGREAQLWVPF